MNSELYLTPSLRLRESMENGSFDDGNGHGLFQLLKLSSTLVLSPGHVFFRRFAREIVSRLCRFQAFSDKDLTEVFQSIRLSDDDLSRFAFEAPPMKGGEYLSTDFMALLQNQLFETIQQEYNQFDGPLPMWLRAIHPVWKNVGKISFHLAENRNDPDGDRPFALLVTFIYRLSESEKPKHLPLSAALKAYANDRAALETMLAPIQAVAEQSPLIKALLDSRRIFVPTALTITQAHTFLKEVHLYEEANILVRIANIWKSTPPKASVAVRLDTQSKKLSASSLLKFSVSVALDGQDLTPEEIRKIMAAQEGMVRLKGQWVEVDSKRLKKLLDDWNEARQQSARSGLTFFQGLRMLAGSSLLENTLPAVIDRSCLDVEAVGSFKTMLDNLQAPDSIPLPTLPESLLNTLRPYQLEGVKYLWRLSKLSLGACLADDMGLGKTLQVLAFLTLMKNDHQLDKTPALLIVPATLLKNWCLESDKFTPDLKMGILHPSTRTKEEMAQLKTDPMLILSQYEVVLITYGMLQRIPALQALTWPVVIADEAQAIKTPSSRQSKAVRATITDCRFALTGTPVENDLMDLWTLFDFINPGLLGNQTTFKNFAKKLNPNEKTSENTTENAGERVGEKNTMETVKRATSEVLETRQKKVSAVATSASEPTSGGYGPLRRLICPFILRRLKTDRTIISDLPDKTELKVYCSLAKAQAVVYQQAVDRLAEALKQTDEFGNKRRGVILGFLTQFKQICNHPSQYDGTGSYVPAQSGKFLRIGELVEPIAQRQEKLLVFTQFRELTEPIHEYLSTCFGRPGLILHGGTAVKKRAALVESFQREDGPPFFVLSLKAAGTGLNLTAANHVVHFDRWWNPAVENQATDRAFRIGQKKNVLVHKFVCRGTLEERIDELITQKQSMADSLLADGAEKLLTNMTNSELLDFVRLDLKAMES